MDSKLVSILEKIAVCPSFSSYENTIHPIIKEILSEDDNIFVECVLDNNLFGTIPGNLDLAPIVLTAHLDKINHFGEQTPEKLDFKIENGKIIGLLDDAVGVAIILYIALYHLPKNRPTIYLCLSEMEESNGLRLHRHLLRNAGVGLYTGMGAKRLSEHMLSKNIVPQIIITIDTTPLFKEQSGVALYYQPWVLNQTTVDEKTYSKSETIRNMILESFSDIKISNNTNDYLEYGKVFNPLLVPSIAIEPSIFPYHTFCEQVYCSDVEKTIEVTKNLVNRLSQVNEMKSV